MCLGASFKTLHAVFVKSFSLCNYSRQQAVGNRMHRPSVVPSFCSEYIKVCSVRVIVTTHHRLRMENHGVEDITSHLM